MQGVGGVTLKHQGHGHPLKIATKGEGHPPRLPKSWQLERHTASYMTTETIQSPYASLGNKYPRIKGNTLFVFHRATYACRSDKNRMNPVVSLLPHLHFGFHPDGLYTPFYLLVCWGNYAALSLELVLANVYT